MKVQRIICELDNHRLVELFSCLNVVPTRRYSSRPSLFPCFRTQSFKHFSPCGHGIFPPSIRQIFPRRVRMTLILKATVRSVQSVFAWPPRPHHVQYCRFWRVYVAGRGGPDESLDEEEIEERFDILGELWVGDRTGVSPRMAIISLRL